MSTATAVSATRIGSDELTRIVAPDAKPISQNGVSIPTRDYQAWVNGDGSIETGIWECDTGVFRARFEHHGEMIYIVQGEMVCTPDSGEAFTLSEGDSCTFPKGWAGAWEVKRPIRKLYTVWTNES
ncbi:MAG: cupin domain-containing protein [Thermomicrobiales bacterium]